MGMATPGGIEVRDAWDKALGGVSSVRRLSYPGGKNSPVQAVGQISEDDWQRIVAELPDDAAREGERRTIYSLWSALRAARDSGCEDVGGDRRRWGVCLASGLGINRLEDVARWAGSDGTFDLVRFGREFRQVHRESIMRNQTHHAAALIARKLNLRGDNRSITTACASATTAIGTAMMIIRRGEADVMLAGGSDSMINPIGLVFFALLGAASRESETPETACRPFDRRRGGLVMGEGAGVVVLEELEHARARGARIYAEVIGYGSSMDAHQATAPHPEGAGAVASMAAALRDAHIGPADIDYINAHGTSTKLNDPTETLAIKEVFGPHAFKLAINSSKSVMGHLLAGAGGPEFIFTTMSVSTDVVHPTVNLEAPDPKCDLDYVPGHKREMTVRTALSNSYGFGGQNASVVVAKYPGKATGLSGQEAAPGGPGKNRIAGFL